MSSAKTVAQKPAGNFNPPSSFGHAWLLASAAGLNSFSAGTDVPPMPIAANTTRADNTVFSVLDNCIGDSEDLESSSLPGDHQAKNYR
jgi:hypothetical protein